LLITGFENDTVRPVGTLQSWNVMVLVAPFVVDPRITIG
jgi:hypothetical protein